MKNVIGFILKFAIVFINVWFIVSFIDVILHNTNLDGGTILATWNFFKVIM